MIIYNLIQSDDIKRLSGSRMKTWQAGFLITPDYNENSAEGKKNKNKHTKKRPTQQQQPANHAVCLIGAKCTRTLSFIHQVCPSVTFDISIIIKPLSVCFPPTHSSVPEGAARPDSIPIHLNEDGVECPRNRCWSIIKRNILNSFGPPTAAEPPVNWNDPLLCCMQVNAYLSVWDVQVNVEGNRNSVQPRSENMLSHFRGHRQMMDFVVQFGGFIDSIFKAHQSRILVICLDIFQL